MVTARAKSGQGRQDAALPLTLEIARGREASQQFPVRIRSLSARGVILAAAEVPSGLDLDSCSSGAAVIHVPKGEVREVPGNLIWARPRGGDGAEATFGLELASSNLKVRRALEEHLLAYPQDLKNMWDHWDAVYDDHEAFGSGQVSAPPPEKAPEPHLPAAKAPAAQPPEPAPTGDNAFYWVGVGGVLAGLGVYFLGPETYRLLGIILAAYGSLTIAGKGVWSMMQKRPRSQG